MCSYSVKHKQLGNQARTLIFVESKDTSLGITVNATITLLY